MPDLIAKITTTGADVRTGDLLTVGGIPHVVGDVREVAGNRKRLQFTDGNAYVLTRFMNIEVTRAFPPNQGRPRIPKVRPPSPDS